MLIYRQQQFVKWSDAIETETLIACGWIQFAGSAVVACVSCYMFLVSRGIEEQEK